MRLVINAKCSDCCFTQLIKDGKIVSESHGYVPLIEGVGADGYGDYVNIEIDTVTGKVVGFNTNDEETIRELIENEQ